jgi:protein ImuA
MSQTLPPAFDLRPARIHEAEGPAAPAFALMQVARQPGPVLWVQEGWQTEGLNPQGLLPFFDPTRLFLARTRSQTDSLAVAEEALKDGAVPVVVVAVTRALDLREGRRLQLAAQAGSALGLCLIPQGMGSNATETRWHCAPVFDAAHEADSTRMRWETIKNKSGTMGAWDVRWDPQANRLDLVSPAGQRPGLAPAPG